MSPDFFGDCGRILAQEPGNILKGSALIQFVFDIDTVFKGKVFLVTRNIFTHHEPPSDSSRRRNIMSKYIPSNQKHLTHENNIYIENELNKGTSFNDIARLLCKDHTTI